MNGRIEKLNTAGSEEAMNIKLIRTCILLITTALLLQTSSCATIGDRPVILDPEFSGTWVRNRVELVIGHDEGTVSAVGFNNRPSASWDSLTFTGVIHRIGIARGNAQVWGVDSQDNQALIAEFPLEIPREGDTIALDLAPLQESYNLRKQ